MDGRSFATWESLKIVSFTSSLFLHAATNDTTSRGRQAGADLTHAMESFPLIIPFAIIPLQTRYGTPRLIPNITLAPHFQFIFHVGNRYDSNELAI